MGSPSDRDGAGGASPDERTAGAATQAADDAWLDDSTDATAPTEAASSPESVPAAKLEMPSPYAATEVASRHEGTAATLSVGSDAELDALPWERRLGYEQPGRYRVEETIGTGGFGSVIRVYDRHLERPVALKQLHLERRPGDVMSAVELRFVNEARITGRLEHPGIVPVYELGRRLGDDAVYYIMRLVRGETLLDALEAADGLQARLKLLPHFVDACNALAYAHSRGVMHRDIKPENIMLGPFGQTLVVDWGLAKVRGEDDLQSEAFADGMQALRDHRGVRTIHGSALGTPAYMPPEQCLGLLEEIDERSDVYALGAVLYHLITGAPPFLDDTVALIIKRTINSELVPPREREPECPPELEAIALRALQKMPEERYADASALAEDVGAFLAGGIVGAHRYTARQRISRWVRANRWALLGSFVALALATGTWGYRDWVHRERAASAEAERLRGQWIAETKRREQVAKQVDDILRDTEAGATQPRWLETYAFEIVTLDEPVVSDVLEDRLISALKHPSAEVRRLVARSLGGLASKRAVDALTSRLGEKAESDEEVLVEIINALGVIGDSRAEKAVDAARWRAGQHSRLWEQTKIAYRLIPLPPLVDGGAALNGDEWTDRGRSASNKGDRSGAIEAYTRALKLQPKLARAWNNRAIELVRDERFEEGLRDYDRAIELEPDEPKALYNRAVLKRKMENYQGAIDDYTALIAKGKLEKMSLRSRANALRWLDKHDEALADYERALALDPKDPRTHYAIGNTLTEMERWTEAIASLDRALVLNGDMVEALVMRGYAHRMNGDLDTAMHELDHAIEIDPSHDSARVNRASLRLQRGDRKGAFEDLNHCLTTKCGREDEYGAVRYQARAVLGHFAEGKLPAALGDLESAFKLARTRSDTIETALYGLAVSLRMAGRESRETWAARLEPNNKPWWHERLAAMVLGKGSYEELSAATPQKTNRCTLLLGAGIRQDLQGHRDEARALYAQADTVHRPAELSCALASLLGVELEED